MEKLDLIVDLIKQVRDAQQLQCNMCEKRFEKLEKTIFGNGLPGLKAKVYLLMILVVILFSFHGITIAAFQ